MKKSTAMLLTGLGAAGLYFYFKSREDGTRLGEIRYGKTRLSVDKAQVVDSLLPFMVRNPEHRMLMGLGLKKILGVSEDE